MTPNLEKIFNFLHEVEGLKSTLRYSFTKTGRQESSAEHSWRLSLMVFIVANEMNLRINKNRAIKIAIVHDLAEAITGDIDALEIANNKISKKEKETQELKAMNLLKDKLPEISGDKIFDLWSEYEEGETQEAKFVKAIDKLETTTQLVEIGYKKWDYPEFIVTYPDKAVKNFPELIEMLKILKRKLKVEFEKGGLEWKKEYDSLG